MTGISTAAPITPVQMIPEACLMLGPRSTVASEKMQLHMIEWNRPVPI